MWTPTAVQSAALDARRDQERVVSSFLAAWLECPDGEGPVIAKGEAAWRVAESLAGDDGMLLLAAVLMATGEAPDALRAAAVGLADLASMTPAALSAELFWHGHDPY
jgi:hypothetical protein